MNKNDERDGNKKVSRFLFQHGVSLTTLIAVAYYAGIFMEQNRQQSTALANVEVKMTKIESNVQQISTDVAVLKTRIEGAPDNHRTPK